MKTKIKLLTASAALAVVAPLVTTITSCSKKDYTNLSKTIQRDAINEFWDICSVYRRTFKTRKICDYLKNRIIDIGLSDSIKEDEYRAELEDGTPDPESSGNLTFEIPATRGCEQYPKVIIQGHMDMVCEDGNTGYDWSNGVVPIHEGDRIHSLNYKTTLGADDGIGLGTILSLAKHRNEYTHGPIRFLITTDEENGVSGASAVPVEWFDAPYLINIDGEIPEDITTSCAGTQEAKFEAEFEAIEVPHEDEEFVITIKGLQGGHSGFEIGKNKINAICAMVKLIEYIQNAPSGNTVRLASVLSNGLYTSLAKDVTFTIAADIKVPATEVQDYCTKFQSYCKFLHPIEKDLTITCEKITYSAEPETKWKEHSLSVADTTKLIEFIELLPSGPISYNEETGAIETSLNMGGSTGAIASDPEKDAFCIEERPKVGEESVTVMHTQFGIQGRSSNRDHLGERPTETGSDYTGFWKYFKSVTDHVYGDGKIGTYMKTTGWLPPWPYQYSKIWDVLKKAATENKSPINEKNILAWSETAYFVYKKQSLQQASISFWINNAHETTETLYISSVQKLAFNLLYTFDNLPKTLSEGDK